MIGGVPLPGASCQFNDRNNGMANPPRPVFFVSDSTGITVETLGQSLLHQFPELAFGIQVLRYVDTPAKARKARDRIRRAGENGRGRPIVFSTLIDEEARALIRDSGALCLDLFECFMGPLQQELHARPHHAAGRTHGVIDDDDYTARIEAVNFALKADDGVSSRHYPDADIVLVGVSRTGKTPTCLYLALHYGLCAANHPLTEEDLERERLPKELEPFREKLFGLTIHPERLHRIRSQRRPDSEYASLARCRHEVQQAEAILRAAGVPVLDTTTMSVEEIATTIISRVERRRNGREG